MQPHLLLCHQRQQVEREAHGGVQLERGRTRENPAHDAHEQAARRSWGDRPAVYNTLIQLFVRCADATLVRPGNVHYHE